MGEARPEIQKVRELLKIARHAAMATVNEDGSPHNTPLVLLYDPNFTKIYWSSYPDSVHSRNITRTGQLFVVVYDAAVSKYGGLYIRANEGHVVEGKELIEAVQIHNAFRSKLGKRQLEISYYMGDNPQRMWSANVTNLWVYARENNSEGLLVKDYRVEIERKDLVEV